MMKTMLLVACMLCGAVLVSCGEQSEKAEEGRNQEDLEAMRAEVMKLHDDVMPKTADIQARIKELQGTDTTRLSDSMRALIIMDLEAADKAMWDWMAGFEDPEDNLSVDEKYIYYEEQKKSIEEVAKMIRESLDKSEGALNE